MGVNPPFDLPCVGIDPAGVAQSYDLPPDFYEFEGGYDVTRNGIAFHPGSKITIAAKYRTPVLDLMEAAVSRAWKLNDPIRRRYAERALQAELTRIVDRLRSARSPA